MNKLPFSTNLISSYIHIPKRNRHKHFYVASSFLIFVTFYLLLAFLLICFSTNKDESKANNESLVSLAINDVFAPINPFTTNISDYLSKNNIAEFISTLPNRTIQLDTDFKLGSNSSVKTDIMLNSSFKSLSGDILLDINDSILEPTIYLDNELLQLYETSLISKVMAFDTKALASEYYSSSFYDLTNYSIPKNLLDAVESFGSNNSPYTLANISYNEFFENNANLLSQLIEDVSLKETNARNSFTLHIPTESIVTYLSGLIDYASKDSSYSNLLSSVFGNTKTLKTSINLYSSFLGKEIPINVIFDDSLSRVVEYSIDLKRIIAGNDCNLSLTAVLDETSSHLYGSVSFSTLFSGSFDYLRKTINKDLKDTEEITFKYSDSQSNDTFFYLSTSLNNYDNQCDIEYSLNDIDMYLVIDLSAENQTISIDLDKLEIYDFSASSSGALVFDCNGNFTFTTLQNDSKITPYTKNIIYPLKLNKLELYAYFALFS